MSVRSLRITFCALLFLLMAGSEFAFSQGGTRGITSYDRPRGGRGGYDGPVARPNQGLTFEQAMQQKYGIENAHIQDQRDEWERERLEWERRQAEEEARIAQMEKRPSVERKTNAGFQSPTELDAALEKLGPGSSIELHGDLFTAYDGTILSATYYRGAAGKDSVPIVLLHGKNGTRRDFDAIIPTLTSQGMAVLVPDIRGHGKSVERIIEEFDEPSFFDIPPEEIPRNPFAFRWLSNRWNGYERMSADIAAGVYAKPATRISVKRCDKFEGPDYAAMVYDLQVWHEFLTHENNQERLNIKKTNLVGIDMGAWLAIVWGRNDQAPIDTGKETKQVKTMTLISPKIYRDSMEIKNGDGIADIGFLKSNSLRTGISTMIIVGKNNTRALEDAQNVRKIILNNKEDNEPGIKAKCPLIQCNTERQGRDLFSLTSAKIDQGIPFFIKDRLGKLEEKVAEKKNDKTLTWAKMAW